MKSHPVTELYTKNFQKKKKNEERWQKLSWEVTCSGSKDNIKYHNFQENYLSFVQYSIETRKVA